MCIMSAYFAALRKFNGRFIGFDYKKKIITTH